MRSFFRITVQLIFPAITLVICSVASAMNLDYIKVSMLKSDYKAAIAEGEKILATDRRSKDDDELYYLLGVSYLKEKNYLRASDIFDIVVKEFKSSRYREEALLGLGDVCFLQGDYKKAQEYYFRVLQDSPRTKLKAQLYARLSQTGFKNGDTQQGKGYEEKLKNEFPLNLESTGTQDICSLVDFSQEPYYSVQVGCFSQKTNALNLVSKLKSSGFDSFIHESSDQNKQVFRVKVGKFKTRNEASAVEQKLSSQGYPTKVSP